MKKLFLFDIDGTLISPSNIARKLLDKILIDQFGKSPNLKYEDVAGSTDLLIIENALRLSLIHIYEPTRPLYI